MSLKKTAISGFKWSSISQVGRQIIQLITTIILARLLSPSDFGLLGMVTVITGFVAIFKDLGTSAAIIQQKNLSEKLLSSIFWINIAFGLLATAILFGLAPWVSEFYQEPRIIPLLRVLSISFFVSGISILQQAILERELKFNTLAKIEIMAISIASIFGISLAFLGWGVWSLVYQTLSMVVITTIILWLVTQWRPQMIFDWQEVKAVSNYSLNLTGFSIFNYFVRNSDYLLVGRFLGAEQLGYYTLAYKILLYPLQNIAWVVIRVMFPILSQMQDDHARFRYAYLRVVKMIALITFPLMFGLWGVAEPFVLTLFGSQWSIVTRLLLILAPLGLVQSLGTTVGTIYQAKGRIDWMLRWGIAAGILAVLSFIIGLQWGIIGVAGAYAIASIILLYPNFAIPFKLIDLPINKLLQVLWQPFISSLLMLAVILGVKIFLPANLESGWILGILIPVGIIAYLIANWFINRQQLHEFIHLVKPKS